MPVDEGFNQTGHENQFCWSTLPMSKCRHFLYQKKAN